MDLKLVKNLLDLISESEVNEVSIEEGDFKIKIKKISQAPQPLQYQLPAQQPQQEANPQPLPQQQPEQPAGSETSPAQAEGEVVKSPIVGTFYEAASPDSDPFVKVGDTVKKGQTLCIVEAMKIMNEIESEFNGVVQQIIVENGQPVEFDQPLFIIKKA